MSSPGPHWCRSGMGFTDEFEFTWFRPPFIAHAQLPTPKWWELKQGAEEGIEREEQSMNMILWSQVTGKRKRVRRWTWGKKGWVSLSLNLAVIHIHCFMFISSCLTNTQINRIYPGSWESFYCPLAVHTTFKGNNYPKLYRHSFFALCFLKLHKKWIIKMETFCLISFHIMFKWFLCVYVLFELIN